MTCRDLGQVIDLFLKYYHLLAPALHLDYEVVGERCVLTLVSSLAETPLDFAYELISGAMLNTLQGLLNRHDLQLHLEVPYPAPAHADRYFEVFGPDVQFNCVAGRIAFDRELLPTPLPSSNPALRSLYENECARLLADLEEEPSVAEQTLRLMRKLEGQYPDMPQTAKMLNLSPRTYRRRLESEQHSYQQLLDQVRAEHATRYLQNTRLPLSSIAYLIGFNDASNFRRAYLKWTGRSPSEVRHGAARALSVYLGREAARRIGAQGWSPDLFSLLLGASGGPKWFVLGQLDRLLFGDFLRGGEQAPVRAGLLHRLLAPRLPRHA